MHRLTCMSPPPIVNTLSITLQQSTVHLVLVSSAPQEMIAIFIYLKLRQQVHTFYVPPRLSRASKFRQQVHTSDEKHKTG